MGDDALNAKSAETLLFVRMGVNALNAKSVEAVIFASMGDKAFIANSAVALLLLKWETSFDAEMAWVFYKYT